ncbi:BolA (bacterial stress-induced morphogen)-related protein [Plasmopara halstedii]|uniref:BolA (Bacterial stress-induced morphogen)-related protein n=1 Tax=Plasmopara halstedii TaxID=4781 RepID=A0A0P1AHY3_PLAHL|nr:BolA (bacterial stress-induced morphogen)-related protein [Plasmopara halstedii]CEG40351.1 BolA (bacterial stress-induced morphogen)-related protein [Plasmopara halstedii]|eukprot:XP_024576720.1 BolA (bacterial stress-induced morphogen)-related protein [Plasmopara halstedii]
MNVVTPAHLEAKIRDEIGAVLVEATDLSDGCGSKFSLVVVHEGFEGQSLLERQRQINDCLKEEMTRIHALQMKTWTPAQYEQKTLKKLPTNSQSPGEQ